ncbi:HAD-IA family hydrolase [Treponema sp.]|uniref:HAD-IA family hydrolase n=1 Tax=Treponema sp. TaxID=166 RepID=UPI0025F2D000|nr:HAD-IA family hydrolase [Treponema sp.]MCR5217582.1 HAD-IA family hydrolase [Treponema sp.]
MNKLVVFDFDGTLADSVSVGLPLINSYSEKFGFKEIDLEKSKHLSAKEIIFSADIKLWKLPYVIAYLRRRLSEKVSQIKCIEGIPELLKKLKESGFDLCILTSNSKPTVTGFLKNNNLDSYFTYIKTGVSLFGKKRAIKSLKKKLGNDMIYVGDELRDVDACRKTSTPVVSVTWGVNSPEVLEKANPGLLASSPVEAFEKIMGLSK